MSQKYAALAAYLENQNIDLVSLSFAQIENIIGMALPDSARKHAVWWSNSPSRGRHNQAWLGSGWETTNRNLKAQTISFQRAGEPAKSQGHIATAARPRRANGATFRSEEHTSALQSLMRISYAVFCLTKQNKSIPSIT